MEYSSRSSDRLGLWKIDWLTHGTMESGVRLVALPLRRLEFGKDVDKVKYMIRNKRLYVRYRQSTGDSMAAGSAVYGGESLDSSTVCRSGWTEMQVQTAPVHGIIDGIYQVLHPCVDVSYNIGVYRLAVAARPYTDSCVVLSRHGANKWYRIINGSRKVRELMGEVVCAIMSRLDDNAHSTWIQMQPGAQIAVMKTMVPVASSGDNWSDPPSALSTLRRHASSWLYNDKVLMYKAVEGGLCSWDALTVEEVHDQMSRAQMSGYSLRISPAGVFDMESLLGGQVDMAALGEDVPSADVVDRGNAWGIWDTALEIDGKLPMQLLKLTTTSRGCGNCEKELKEGEQEWKM